jgi:hypothetical protein
MTETATTMVVHIITNNKINLIKINRISKARVFKVVLMIRIKRRSLKLRRIRRSKRRLKQIRRRIH